MAKAGSGQSTVHLVEQLVRPVIEELGFSLWDVRYEKEGPDWYLRIFADNPAGQMDMNACETISRAIDPVIDAADPIDEAYFMEVGSPGLGRRLTRAEHFAPYVGQKIAARLIRPDATGNREQEGVLQRFENGEITLETTKGTVAFALAATSFVKLCDDENLFS